MTTLTDYPPATGTITVIGPGMPGNPENYLPPYDYPYGTYDPVRTSPTSGTTDNTGTANTGGSTAPTWTTNPNASIIIVGGTDPRSPTDVGDGTVATVPLTLDIAIREGIKISGGESQTSSVVASIIDQSGTNVSWDNVQGLISGNEVTSVSLTNGQTSNYLEFSVFDLDIPDGASVTGITITINRKFLSGSGTEFGEIYRCAVQ